MTRLAVDSPSIGRRFAVAVAVVLGASGLAAAGSDVPGADAPATAVAPTAGAYVDSRTCRPCHLALYDGYQHVGMARSFFRPDPRRDIEDFAAGPFRHDASGESYEMVRSDGRLLFRRWQEDRGATAAEGAKVGASGEERPSLRHHLLEIPVDWVLGSGHHSRTYLYRTAAGELYQLPIAWYSAERKWEMAPGFDRPDHLGVQRRVQRECLFCHNAYPELPEGGDVHGVPALFPAELPEGIGCQRCHGPGERHIALAHDEGASAESIRAAITNPGRLAPALRDDVCFQCHLQPAVALAGVRRFGRGDFSYRPGEPLADYLVQVDVRQELEDEPSSAAGDDRFEINHAAHRLRQSRCFTASAGRLSCLSCHDPHRRLAPSEKVAHYRQVCAGCHAADDCTLPPAEAELAAALHGPGGDCAGCHMPRRRPEDVVHVAMIDHRIGRHPESAKLLAPRVEREPILHDAWLLEPERVGADAGLYRTVAVARSGASPEALRHLATLLERLPSPPHEALFDLARGLLERGESATAARVLARRGAVPVAVAPAFAALEALAAARLGRGDEARAQLRGLAGAGVASPEALANLARLELDAGEARRAIDAARAAVAARPHLGPAWNTLAAAARREGDLQAAEQALRTALVWEPRDGRSLLALVELLVEPAAASGEASASRRAEALGLLRHAVELTPDAAQLRRALAELERP